MLRLRLFFSILYGVLLLQGCATSTLQTQAKMTRIISLNPDQLKDKSVYLRVTGTQASKIELEAPLKKALQDRGVRIVDNADEARFYLHVNTLFADNLKEAARLDVALFGGVAAGAIATVNNSGGDSLLIGVGVALAMGVADRALADETYRAVISVNLKERITQEESKEPWSHTKEDETRLFIEAVRMGLNLEDAKPIMEDKAVYQIAEIFK
ncbi:complement resistance protein TraT [Sulfurospirillum diekertiae]|uniref:Lipoprotein YlpA n=1 Tax=Sulfurospirillum diekertiae TaxID=1854492 RepID=A0A1Y0HJ93_9BACT|nr:complement resistance protein TraT [Sulfurospirillum diekertiae]ARU48128.1 Lipoprotein YlpA [Sulfurospirillum diekertiae]ASC92971.1 Lipoprotein YlpA [Sulfurospirillum diekertiae]